MGQRKRRRCGVATRRWLQIADKAMEVEVPLAGKGYLPREKETGATVKESVLEGLGGGGKVIMVRELSSLRRWRGGLGEVLVKAEMEVSDWVEEPEEFLGERMGGGGLGGMRNGFGGCEGGGGRRWRLRRRVGSSRFRRRLASLEAGMLN